MCVSFLSLPPELIPKGREAFYRMISGEITESEMDEMLEELHASAASAEPPTAA